MQTTAIGTVANSLPENEVILLTLLISKGYILFAELHNYIGNLRLLCCRLGKIKIYFPPFEAWRQGVNSVLYLPRQGKHCFLQRKAVLSGGESIAFLFFTIRLPQTSKGNSRRGRTSLPCPAGSLPASQDLNGGLLSLHVRPAVRR